MPQFWLFKILYYFYYIIRNIFQTGIAELRSELEHMDQEKMSYKNKIKHLEKELSQALIERDHHQETVQDMNEVKYIIFVNDFKKYYFG